ncbi:MULTISPECIES: aldehyde dehydrogenase family protein [Klebsiella/Raoultella group]|uniref:aldehyde dehydrogenase family protein n=1 Tax=Klebsiella/Raoultella group TaxID=2890311 RepID=UPI0015A75763|nr:MULTISPECIES: aldehyde dehydrogenase family protein [Klebsiella/Raoultella group]QLK20875.1 aldehyde dehydrogenase family protein [Raoultella ornithinolytica]
MSNANHKQFADAVKAQRDRKPVIVPHVIAGKEYFDGPLLEREDPSKPSIIVSGCHDAPADLVHLAVEKSREAQREWIKVPIEERIARVAKAYDYVASKVDDWTVRVALEIGKNLGGARAEALEVLEILKFYVQYSREPGAFEDARETDPTGLKNLSVLRPYGVFGFITPFNYPIVQAAGPTIAALLAGNGMVIKATHHGPWSCHAVYEMCAAMDLPVGLVNIIHGADEPGRTLVSADVDGMSFTGSVSVGQEIIRRFSNGPYPRPVVAEMGGKNPVIVTDSADLEMAADGIVFSAFDLIGQKCTALSRVIATPKAYKKLVELVAERRTKLLIADPTDEGCFAGPLVDKRSVQRFEKVVKQAKDSGFRIDGGEVMNREGYYVEPTVISAVPVDHELAVTEYFLPLISISEVPDFESAIEAANATTMGLTAGIYTGDKEEARTFLREIEAGNVNVNVPGHATTGWWPGPQTMGGWKASGSTGKHALGKWYVGLFARQQSRKTTADLESLLDE